MEKIIPGKNYAGDDLWNFLNNKAEIDLSQDNRSEVNFLRRFVSSAVNKECLEIGSFPGSNLSALGSLGYTLNGMDISPRNAHELPDLLKQKGYKVGEFWTADIFSFEGRKNYDLVCSFGFIEHFENYLEVIRLHAQYVNKEGLLIITAPNFKGKIQYAVHYLFDKPNLNIHNIESMNPHNWATYLEKEGFEIIFKGYFGGLYFWLGNKGRNWFEKLLLYLIHGIASKLRKVIKFDSSMFSYNCGIVAKKIK